LIHQRVIVLLHPVECCLQSFCMFALSSEGQAIVASQQGSAEGYVPLSADDLAAERRKLLAAP